ncbi:hypothetical protein M446_4131 [Methylobacterium sp. 4-46]|uniref:hypothetical protein n=1 Tax=unclassified Methylobacterium TaxID=2615210 RepID=UPI000152DF56|nr:MULTISPECIES: hypothetical protein [Methylobacterium]ACA18488.1 hypothetical protein M446_4131 [Methylobacterium sp. 4-46]WFT77776.1 hypothetical protein QA634_20980 [Methylobacterium nodulans]
MPQTSADVLAALSLDHGAESFRDAPVAFLRARGVPDAVIVPAVRAKLAALVDAKAEALRLALVTPGAGQAMEYQETLAQARAALAMSGTPVPGDYPLLAATVGLDVDPQTGAPASDVKGVARAVVAAAAAWIAAAAAIRGARLTAKAAIAAAATPEAAVAAFEAASWPAL